MLEIGSVLKIDLNAVAALIGAAVSGWMLIKGRIQNQNSKKKIELKKDEVENDRIT